jgi:pimeloyl-ACP methyl ester carboxylesterase
VALELALAHPGCVRSLALLTPFVRAEGRLLAVLDAWCRLGAEASREALAAAIVPWLFSPHFLADGARRARATHAFAESAAAIPAATLRRAAAGLRAWSGTREADLGKLRVPVLVIAGDDDLLTPRGPELARAIPGARCVVVPGAHAAALESADAVNAALLEHLAAS